MNFIRSKIPILQKIQHRCTRNEQSLLFDQFKAFDKIASSYNSPSPEKIFFPFIRAQHVLSHHLIKVPGKQGRHNSRRYFGFPARDAGYWRCSERYYANDANGFFLLLLAIIFNSKKPFLHNVFLHLMVTLYLQPWCNQSAHPLSCECSSYIFC